MHASVCYPPSSSETARGFTAGRWRQKMLFCTAGISPSPGSRRCMQHRSSAPAKNSNSEASHTALLSRLSVAGIPGVEFISASEMARRYQLKLAQRDADACAVAVIAASWKKLRRGDLKALDKLGMDLATSSAAIDLALPPVDSVPPEDFKDLDKMGSPTIHLSPSPIDPVDKVVWEPMKALNQLDGATGDFIMEDDSNDCPPSLNFPSSTGSNTLSTLCSPFRFVNFVRSLTRLIMMSDRAMTQCEFRVGELMLMG